MISKDKLISENYMFKHYSRMNEKERECYKWYNINMYDYILLECYHRRKSALIYLKRYLALQK